MRASRLLSILLLLQNRGRMTAKELADELEVSVRTVYRDMESLGAAGVPVYGDAGHSGGYSLVDGYRTRLTGLHGDEADALALAGLPGPAAELGLGAVLAAAQLKVTAALPSSLRERTGRIQERFHLDAPGWYREAEPLAYLTAIADAVWNQRPIRVRYHRWAEPQEVDRSLNPYGIVLKGGSWYLVAADARGEPRVLTYRISQIRDLTVDEDAVFERPAGFDLAEYWRASLADFDARRFRSEAVLLVTAGVLERMPDLLEPAVARAARLSAEPASGSASAWDGNARKGWLRITIPIESVPHTLPQLLQFGGDLQVVEPPDLRRAMVRAATAILERYPCGAEEAEIVTDAGSAVNAAVSVTTEVATQGAAYSGKSGFE